MWWSFPGSTWTKNGLCHYQAYLFLPHEHSSRPVRASGTLKLNQTFSDHQVRLGMGVEDSTSFLGGGGVCGMESQ